MMDRVSTDPGRVLVVPEGEEMQSYYATLYRADNPTQEGTPLNKATFLKDATAALYGLGNDAVPDDVLEKLGDAVLYVSGSFRKPNNTAVSIANAAFVTGTYTGNGAASKTISLGFQPSAVLLFDEKGCAYENIFYSTSGSITWGGGLSLRNNPITAEYIYKQEVVFSGNVLSITSNGFTVYYKSGAQGTTSLTIATNAARTFYYLAFK